MSRQVTLGGDRLGSGNNNRVELHGFERSNHDLSYIWRSTMAAGTLVPFLSKVILPGDTMDIDLNANVMTHPTIGPLFGSFKVQLDLFQIPVRLYVGKLHQNAINIGLKMNTIRMPEYNVNAVWDPAAKDIDNSQVNPSCILAYLGMRGLGRTQNGLWGTVNRNFNAVPLLGYWDIYKQYYANKQEEKGYYIHWEPEAMIRTITTVTIGASPVIPEAPTSTVNVITPSTSIRLNYNVTAPKPDQIIFNTNRGEIVGNQLMGRSVVTGTYVSLTEPLVSTVDFQIYNWRYRTQADIVDKEPILKPFDLENIDNMRNYILEQTNNPAGVRLTGETYEPYNAALRESVLEGYYSKMSSQEGLGIKTYQSDLFNNWLNEEWIDGEGGINEISSVAVTDDSFTIDALNLANKVYNLFNRIAVSDGSYQAYIGAAYDHDMYGLCTNPVYEGGLSKELEFQEVVSTAETGDQPLATLAGKGTMSGKHKGGRATIKANEIGWVMGIISLTPRIDYSQGNEWDINLFTIADFHVPNLDQIGFQDLIGERLHWAETYVIPITNVKVLNAVGKQPAWIEYMTSVNKTFGNFAVKGDEMFMTLNRNYSVNAGGIIDVTTYIDPVKYNQIFAYTKRDAQNFWVQVRIGISARRKMSAKLMPNL